MPIASIKLFINVPDKFLQYSRVASPWTISKYSPRLTGIPPHVSLMAEMKGLKDVCINMRSAIHDDINKSFEKHMTCDSSDYHMNCILQAINTSQQKMDKMMESLGNSSASPSDDFVSDDGPVTILDEGKGIVGDQTDAELETVEDAMRRKRKNIEASMKAVKK